MAERKIPYIIELTADDKKLRQQMAGWNWEEIMGQSKGKSFKDALVKDTKEAKQEIVNTLGGMGLDWGKILGEKEFSLLEKKIGRVIKANKDKISVFANEGDTAGIQKTIDLVTALGNELKGLGSNFDASGIARNITAFMKVLTPISAKMEQLAKEPEKIEAAFDKIFNSNITNGVTKVAQGFTVVGDEAGKANVKTTQAIKDMKKHLSSIDALFNKEYSIKFNSDIDKQFNEIENEIERTSKDIRKLVKEMDSMSISDKNFEPTRNKLTQKYLRQAELLRSQMLLNEKYAAKDPDYKDTLMADNKSFEREINEIKNKISLLIEDAQRQINSISKSTKTTKDGINIPIKLPTQTDLVATINQYVDGINKSKAIHNIKVGIDKDIYSPIEDETKRAYGDKPAVDDVNTKELIEKTASRFEELSTTIDEKQQAILDNTRKWRQDILKAMQLGKGDLSFNFGLDENLELAADGLFNHLQEYFERPENRLNVYFNTKNIAQDLKEELNAEGITINGGGTTTLDTNGLASVLYSVLLGQVPRDIVVNSRNTSRGNANIIPSDLNEETEKATASSERYVQVLDDTTIHIDKVIESLREFAKVATKSNASKGSKEIADLLSNKGIDINKIKNGANDTDIIKMLQNLMVKDEMGHSVGSSLVDTLIGKISTYKMKPTKGAGKVVNILAKDILELFDINNIETELADQVITRLNQLSVYRGVEKQGRALASLGLVRSTQKQLSTGNVKIPALEDFDKAIHFFEVAGENTDALNKFRMAREKLGSDESEGAKAEFEQAAKTFYEESRIVFARLSKQASMFKGMVYAEGRRPIEINPKGAYPYKMLDIPEDAVITKVLPYNPDNTLNEDDFSGGYNRRRRLERQLNYGSSGYDFTVDKAHPKKDVRREEIEYSSFKPQETITAATDVELDILEKQAKQIPELINRINRGREVVADLKNIKQQLESDISRMEIKDLPEIRLNPFKQHTNQKANIDNIVKQADSALKDESGLSVGNTSVLTQGQSSLVNRLQAVLNSIHNDSVASQELARQIFEIEEAQKLSNEDLERLRNQAADILKLQDDKKRAQQEINSLKSRTDITGDVRDSLIAQQQKIIDSSDHSIDSLTKLFNGRSVDPNFYRDLLFDKPAIERRLEENKTQKSTIDSRLNRNKDSAKTLIEGLRKASDDSNNQAIQEAEQIASQLIVAKEQLYAEAEAYVKILKNQNTDDDTRRITLGRLQQTLGALDNLRYDFATIQSYVPDQSFYTDDQRNKTEQWHKNYTNKEVVRLENELKSLEEQLSKETDQSRTEELKKKITNTKRLLTRAKKNVPDNIMRTTQSQFSEREKELVEAQRQLNKDESDLKQAEKASDLASAKSNDIKFLTQYNELLAKEKTLLEEVNRLKKEGADQSVIAAKSGELKQVTQELNNFLKENKTDERSAYAREKAIEYHALLSTAKRQRGSFNSDIEELEADENSIKTYGMTGRTGARATRIVRSALTREFMNGDYVQSLEDSEKKKTQEIIEQKAQEFQARENDIAEIFNEKISDAMTKDGLNPQDKNQIKQFLNTTRGKQYSNDYENEIVALQQDFENFKNNIWNQYRETIKTIRQQAKDDFVSKFHTENGVSKATFKTQDAEGNWVDDIRTYNTKDEALSRIAETKSYIEAERKPLDDLIDDLEAQKKAAIRYGAIDKEDLEYDDRLKEIDKFNQDIAKKKKDKNNLKNQLAEIEGDDSLDKKEQSKKAKAKQKEIDDLDQEIQRLEDRVHNRTELIARKHQEKEDSVPTPEEKVASATEKLANQKERLAQIEDKIAQRRAEYESAKGTEDEMKTLELLDLEIQKRDELQSQIKTTEDNIARWKGQSESQKQVIYSTEGLMPEGGIVGGIVSAVSEAIGSLGAGVDINTEDLAKEATLKAILQVLGGVPGGDDGYGVGRGKKAVGIDEAWKSIPQYKNATTDIDTLRSKAIELKSTLDTLYDEGKTDTIDFLKAQTELGRVMTLLRNKVSKDNPNVYGEKGNKESAQKALELWKTYLTSGDSKLFDNLNNVQLTNINKSKFNSRLKEINGVNTPIVESDVKEPESTLQIKDFDDFKQQAQALKQSIEAEKAGSEEQKKIQVALIQLLQTWAHNEASGFGGKLPNAKTWKKYLTDTGVFDKVDTSITPLTNHQLNKGSKTQEPVPVKVTESKSDKKSEKTVAPETKTRQQATSGQATGGLIQLVSRLATENTLLQVLSALQTLGTTEGGITAPTAAGDLYNQFKALLLGSSIDDHERLAFMNSEAGVISGNVIGNIANVSEELINALRAKYPNTQGFDTQIHTHGKDTGSYFSTEDYQQFSKDYEAGIKKQVLLTQDHISVLDMSAVKSAEEVKTLMDELIKAGDDAKAIKNVFKNNKSGAIFETAKFDSLNANSLVKMLRTNVSSSDTTKEIDALVSKLQNAKKKMQEATNIGYLSDKDSNVAEFDTILEKIKAISEGIKTGTTSYEAQKVKLEELVNSATRYSDIIGRTISQNKRAYVGDAAVEAVNAQRNKIVDMFDTEGEFNDSDIVFVQQYDEAVRKLNSDYQNLANTQQLQDKNQQQALSQQASRAKALGKVLISSINQTKQLKQNVAQSGAFMKNGKAIELGGISDKLDDEQVKNLNSVMRDYVQNTLYHANIENVKFNNTKQQLTYTLRINKDTVADMVVQYNDATRALYAYNKQERESLTGIKAFVQGFKSKLKSISQYIFSITSITRVLSELKKGVTYVREIDSALTELKKVTDETEETYDRFLNTAAKTADKVGSTIKEVVSSTADWARLGYSMKEATKLAESTAVLLNVSEFQSIDDATSALTSTMQAFGYAAEDSMHVVDVMNEIGNNYAVSSDGIATALQDSASSLMAANNSYQEAVALIAAANRVVILRHGL